MQNKLFNKLYDYGFTKVYYVANEEHFEFKQDVNFIDEKDFKGVEVKQNEIVFLDGNHDARYIKKLYDKVTFSGGLVIVHDTNPPNKMHTRPTLCGDAYNFAMSGGFETYPDHYGYTFCFEKKEFEINDYSFSELNIDPFDLATLLDEKVGDEESELRAQYKEKFGRKARKDMTIESIKDKLNE